MEGREEKLWQQEVRLWSPVARERATSEAALVRSRDIHRILTPFYTALYSHL